MHPPRTGKERQLLTSPAMELLQISRLSADYTLLVDLNLTVQIFFPQ